MKSNYSKVNKIFLLLIIGLFAIPCSCNCQFIYFQGNLGYEKSTFQDNSRGDNTSLNVGELSVEANWRPRRLLGLGIGVSYPVLQSSEYSFQDVFTSGNTTLPDWNDFINSLIPGRYTPREYEYEFSKSLSISLFTKLFIESYANTYIEISVSSFSIEESFTFIRAQRPPFDGELSIPAISEEVTIDRNFIVPGLAVGIMPHIQRNLFLNLQFGLQFLSFSDDGFQYVIPYEWNDDEGIHNVAFFESQLQGSSSTLFNIEAGIGYFF